jgi:hypothetical protein
MATPIAIVGFVIWQCQAGHTHDAALIRRRHDRMTQAEFSQAVLNVDILRKRTNRK